MHVSPQNIIIIVFGSSILLCTKYFAKLSRLWSLDTPLYYEVLCEVPRLQTGATGLLTVAVVEYLGPSFLIQDLSIFIIRSSLA